MEEKNIDSLVVVEQLPIIKQQLQIISEEVDKEIKYALSLECDEDSKKEVKDARARLNKIKTTLEEKRKQVKNAVMTPYNEFESIYNELVKNKLVVADNTLKERIDEIEILQKDEKELELKEFAEQWFISKGIEEFVNFDSIGLNITLSASMSSLKDKIIEFCEKVKQDLDLIDLEEFKDEILVEYKNNLDFAQSKITVTNRHKEIETLKQKLEEQDKAQKEVDEILERVEEALEMPKEVIEDDEIIEVQFKVKGTKNQIKQIKNLILELGVEYE